MTEHSYYHNGTVVGDARQAPYNAELFQQLRNLLVSSDGCYVLPIQGSNNTTLLLGVTAAAGRTVDVAAGKAILGGWFYENTAVVNLTLSVNTSGKPRFDRIIIRLNKETQQARLTVLRGSPATIPTIPAINTCDTYLDLPLAYIYVGSGFAATADTEIYDERIVAKNNPQFTSQSTVNNFPNSEWLGIGLNGGLPGWSNTSGGVVENLLPKFDNMRRGRSILLNTSNVSTITSPPINTSESVSHNITCSVDLIVVSGVAVLTFAGVTKNVYPCTNGIQHIIFRVVTTGYTTITIADASGIGQIQLGQITVNSGICTSEPTQEYDEYIFFDTSLYYLYPTRLSTSANLFTTNLWDTVARFSHSHIISGIKGFLVYITANDTGSAASATARVSILTKNSSEVLRVSLEGVPNDYYRVGWGIIPAEDYLWGTDNAFEFYVDVVASGATTMQVAITCVGVII